MPALVLDAPEVVRLRPVPGMATYCAEAMRRAALVLFVLACLGAVGDREPPRLQFIRPPGFVAEGFATEFRLRILPHADNRRLTVEAVSQDDGVDVVHTERQLEGLNEPPLQLFRLLIPSGSYLLVAQLYGVPKVPLATAKAPVTVISQQP